MNYRDDTWNLFPAFTVNKRAVVRSKWRSVVRKALESDFASAISDLPQVGVLQCKGRILTDDQTMWLEMLPDDFWLGNLHATTINTCMPDPSTDATTTSEWRTLWTAKVMEVTTPALEHCWYALALLGADANGFPSNGVSEEQCLVNYRLFTAAAIHWWPRFVQLESRFYERIHYHPKPPFWLEWGRSIRGWLCHSGVPVEIMGSTIDDLPSSGVGPAAAELYSRYCL